MTGPAIHDLVVLRDQDGRTYRSRVEDVSAETLTLARPFDLVAADPVVVGAELLVTWPGPRGIGVLPVRLIDTGAQRRVQLWVLAIVGEGWFEQRRAYVRVAAGSPMSLALPADDPDPQLLAAHLIDVSEAGLRCSIDAESPIAAGVVKGAAVGSRFTLRGVDFDILGRVQSCEQGRAAAGRLEVVVLFDSPVRAADTLRRQVFAQQLHERQLRRAQS